MRSALLSVAYAVCAFGQTGNALEKADEAFRQGDFASASTLARQALARDPDAVHAHMILGVIAAQNNRLEASTKHFEAIVRLDPANPYGYFYLGQAELYRQQWEPAILNFTKALERRHPDPDRVTVELALAQNEVGRPQQALATLSRIAPPPGGHEAAQYHAVTAFARAKLNQPGPAIAAIRNSLQLDDSNVHYWDFLIDELIKTDQNPQALGEAIRAQRKFPDNGDIQFLFALASYHVTESPLSNLALRNLREAEPDSPRVSLAEGLLYRKEGKMEEANQAFRRAAQRGVPDAHLLLGIVYKENGEYAAAEREYREAERLNPRNGQVLLESGKLALARGEIEQARNRFERALEFMPDAPAVHYQLGLIYHRLGQAEKAAAHLKLSKAP